MNHGVTTGLDNGAKCGKLEGK